MEHSTDPHCCTRMARTAGFARAAALFFALFPIFFFSSDPVAASDIPQPGPTFTVNTIADLADGTCGVDHCSLREAIDAANASADGEAPDEIHFNVGSGAQSIALSAALPAVADAVVIDGTTQPGYAGAPLIELNGAGAGESSGLVFTADGSTVRGLAVTHFDQNGVQVNPNASRTRITANAIFDNRMLGIDLGTAGLVTPNDVGDADVGANNRQNYPVLIRAVPDGGDMIIHGRLNSAASTTFDLEFFASTGCDPSGYGEGETFLGSAVVTTDDRGNASFAETLAVAVSPGTFVTATATDPDGNTSEFSQCVPAGAANESWVTALPLASPAAVDQYLNKPGQARWYKVPVFPGSQVTVKLTNLPADYDVVVYKDIAQALQALESTWDLVRHDAEFAPDIFSPGSFSPDVFTPDVFRPDSFGPGVFSPDVFSPDTVSPDIFSPDTFSPDILSAGGFSPDLFSPGIFGHDTFTPDIVSPDIFRPDGAFASAQTRSAVAASGLNGMADERVVVDTGNNTGNYYIRVRGRNGAFDATSPFHLEVETSAGPCSRVDPGTLPSTSLAAAAGNFETIVVTDLAILAETNSPGDMAALQERLALLAARPEVAGVVVDVGADDRVAAARALAEDNIACPYARNVLASAIKAIIDSYWDLNPGLSYVVLAGNDHVIPFYRYPDRALLAPESNYTPPVADGSASQASLRQNYVLGQDAYGARLTLLHRSGALPIPNLATGRLVESAADMMAAVDAYLGTANGVVVPQTALVTGYGFLADGAEAVQAQLEAGTGSNADTLIASRYLAPAESWTAVDLAAKVLDQGRHDLIYLAGHFSAGDLLAADYQTRLSAGDIAASAVDMANTVVFSPGSHAGYNVVNEHGIAGVTQEPDWPQAFAQKGAMLIAGTGYQTGDTEFMEYAEALYLNFSEQLRRGTGPVAIGEAFAAAKQEYLAGAAAISGLDEKTLHIATIYGLPMLRIDMPAGRFTSADDASIVTSTTGYDAPGPGHELDLRFADVTVTPRMSLNMVPLVDTGDPGNSVTATYLASLDGGIVTRPAEPVLPLEVRNVSVSGRALRGVGFRGGSYTDLADILPMTGAPAFDVRSLRWLFTSDTFYPVQLWRTNTYETLVDPAGGATRLMLTPAQFISAAPGAATGTLRRYDSLSLRLFYSGEIATYPSGSTPALADPPAISQVLATTDDGGNVVFSAQVVGDPAAGIQEVWVTYIDAGAAGGGAWRSLDLAQDPLQTTLWQGMLAAAELGETAPEDIRYIVQAANGVGLVTMATNLGAYYRPGVDPAQPSPDPAAPVLALESSPTSGAFNTRATFSAVLTSNGAPLAGQELIFTLGSQRRAVTGNDGRATVTVPLSGLPGQHELQAVFVESAGYAPATAARSFTITRQSTALALDPASASILPGADSGMTATLTEATGKAMLQRTVFFVVSGSGGWYATAVRTNHLGEAGLGLVPLPPGSYSVHAYFGTDVTLPDQSIVTLTDESYAGSMATGSLMVTNNP